MQIRSSGTTSAPRRCAAAALAMFAHRRRCRQELNALIWCDHADPALLQPFEEANGVKVNVKEFEGTGAGWPSSSSRSPATGT